MAKKTTSVKEKEPVNEIGEKIAKTIENVITDERVEFVKEFLSWDKENICPSLKHDDSRLALFTSKTGKTAKVPFPNLVNHRDGEIRSVMGNHGGKKRNTEYFMGSNDPLSYDWNDKSNQMKSIRSLSEYKRYLLK